MHQSLTLSRATPDSGILLIWLVFGVGIFCHFFRIDLLPMGLYLDESSIGYNAHMISLTGADEHGARWPLFFKAFGEYKNPLYIYALAACYRIFGYSEWTTRALSGFCWLAGTSTLYALICRLFSDSYVRLYAVLCLAFTPWLFSLSRVSFELIALYPLLALHLLALRRGFDEGSWKWALVSGAAMGLCLYAYSTFRMLYVFHVALVFTCYFDHRYRKALLSFTLGAVACAIPYVFFALDHFDMLTKRFDILTYMQDPTLHIGAKMWLFITHYAGYFSPSFLMLSGDGNPRHHTGFGGELLLSTVVLLCIALFTLRKEWRDRFRLYLVGGVLLAPLAAALTRDIHHSLRTFSMVVFTIPLSVYGLSVLERRIVRFAVVLTALCAIPYTIHYFTVYPPESAAAFQSYGFREALREATSRTHGRVVLDISTNEAEYIHLLFYGSLERTHVPLIAGTLGDLRPGDVFIYYDADRGTKGLFRVADASSVSAAAK